ncbi:hypothetical protein RCR19_37545 [Streptomyces sp. WAC07094]|uniref:hypothetical protein n=1 Tax=Streptomyces sp. WAC07094 TaxID=3072183 RepID=UPI002EC5106F|nr:hypothetical protein [Streptomyces sp. WAC07094]
MAIRPSIAWRDEVARNPASEELYAPAMLRATEAALASFEEDARSVGGASDEPVLAAVERVVEQLNVIDEEHGTYCTIEREDLCDYIDDVLTEQGVDVAALLARQDMAELTERWREG